MKSKINPFFLVLVFSFLFIFSMVSYSPKIETVERTLILDIPMEQHQKNFPELIEVS